MPEPPRLPEIREVDRIEALVTVNDASRAAEFLDRCAPGSDWTVRVWTAEVEATLIARKPLGSFDETVCTCLSLWLKRIVPVEPGQRFQVVAQDDEALSATGVVRPWSN